MLRISKLADYACIIMQYMAQIKNDTPSAAIIAAHTHVALPTVRKLLKLLSQAHLLSSSRGISGGYTISIAPTSISLIDIIEAVDGPIALTDCCSEKGCDIMKQCQTRESWQDINTVVVDALKSKSLANLLGGSYGQ